ncbi:T9SS type A sorting domain-containing protein [Hymenobacter antarcticus]|uniref:Secretion system C-terminal sorting domain-containing protein n=1 Tax=Hymenobacter antarcticus TaxID=486270 RepID=A0ABP7R593_9BACT
MQTLTFTQKLLRQRRFLSSLIPLFALFVGLGASQSAVAQITDNTVTLNVRGTSGTFNTQAGTAGLTNFFDRDFGTFDSSVPSEVFQINGATLTVQETGGAVYDQGELLFRVFPGTLATAQLPATFTNNATSIDLGTGVLGAGNVRTFTLSAANQNLLAAAVGSASPGTSNRFDVRFRATDNFVTGGSLVSLIRRSVFTRVTPPVNGVTFSNPNVIVDQGNGPVSRTGSVFNGAFLTDQKPSSSATPSFNINDGVLVLKGGSVTTTATGTSVVNGVNLNYIVYASNFAVIANGMLQLNPTAPAASGVRTFELTTGTVNVITPIQTAGNGYILSISYQATFQNGGGFPNTATDNGPANQGYNATFDVDGTKTPPSTITANTIGIAPNGNADVTYNINPSTPRPFQGANLSDPANGGSDYNVNNGQLRLNATTVTTTEAGPNTITNVILYYRTRLTSTPGGAFQAINLTQSGPVSNGVRTFILDPGPGGINPQPNLVATPAVTAAGAYSVDVYYQANGQNASTGANFVITDPPTAPSNVYTANFTVTGTPIAETIWTGARNDNWFDPLNWSNGVPNATKNALVRDLGAGNSVPYPNINSDTRVTTASGALIYDNTGSGPAIARNLILGGTSQASRSIARLIVGQLQVFGDFDNTYDSFIQRENTIIAFTGVNQNITGGTFFRVDIAGGGTKTLAGVMTIQTSLNFLTGVTTGSEPAVVNLSIASDANAGVLRTNIATPSVSVVVLTDRTVFNNNNGAQITGETDASYLFGFARTSRASVLVGEARTYGNMGMTVTFNGVNNPGNVDVTRNTVESYAPVSGRYGIRRIFGVRPSDAATNTGGLVATIVFRYRDSETMNLNGPNTFTPGTSSIPEDRLTIFVSTNSGNTFGLVGRDGPVDVTNNLVTKSGVRTFATFTLGDVENPLPVRLTAFDAKRVGTDALVTWETASEQNSRGYDVQVSTTGKEFRTLTSVPSASPNTNRTTQYRYIDTEANKSGTRYYRLRQIDLDGKETFFNPVAVNFIGKAAETALVAYPNPLNGSEQLHLTFQSANAGKGQLRITDMTGRMVSQQSLDVTAGTTDLAVAQLGDLKTGMYLVRLTLPSGQVQNLKVVKQ